MPPTPEPVVWQGRPSGLVDLPFYLLLLAGAVLATLGLLYILPAADVGPRATDTVRVFRWVLAGVWVLVVVLAWRLLRGKRVVRSETKAGAAAARTFPGMDSEFYELVKALPPREAGETLTGWLARVAPGRYGEALRLHQRYRFDPRGLSTAERRQLREICRAASASAG